MTAASAADRLEMVAAKQQQAVYGAYDGPLIRTEKVSRTYRQGADVVHAVRELSIELPAGELLLVQGKSGSGKTTLLNLMSGLEQPDSGRVLCEGREFSEFSRREMTRWRQHETGFIFQSLALFPGLTAIENVDLAARIAGCGPREAEKRARQHLVAFGLGERAAHRVSELSGGEQQRVALARGLVAHPRVLFADEPTGELDHVTSRKVMDILRAAVDERGVTVCLSSHDPAFRGFADIVCTMSDGRLVEYERMTRVAQSV